MEPIKPRQITWSYPEITSERTASTLVPFRRREITPIASRISNRPDDIKQTNPSPPIGVVAIWRHPRWNLATE